MKQYRAFLLLGFVALFSFVAALGAAVDQFPIKRGTNISHWLSQSKRRGEERKSFFTRKDVELLARLGFDHLRIPVDEEQLWDEAGNKDIEAWSLLDSALNWCSEFKLRAIVDLHILRSHHFNEQEKPLWTQPAAQERFLDCWRQLSAHLKARLISEVAYEPMNEPVADDHEDWNKLVERIIEAIRANEPERVLVVGSNRWQSVDTFDALRVPGRDKNIILSFHFYAPFGFTHYKAGWTKIGEYKGPVHYPGQLIDPKELTNLPEDLARELKNNNGVFNKQKLAAMLLKPVAYAKAAGLPLYCGEWGALPTVDRQERLNWYRDMRSIFEANGIAWATWDYKGGFGIVDREMKQDKELIEVLTGQIAEPSSALPTNATED